jgi:hypothetical protein
MAAVLVLEPIFEADPQPEQYAYRRDRGALAAVKHVHKLINTGHGEIVDADLSSYFNLTSTSAPLLFYRHRISISEPCAFRLTDFLLSTNSAPSAWIPPSASRCAVFIDLLHDYRRCLKHHRPLDVVPPSGLTVRMPHDGLNRRPTPRQYKVRGQPSAECVPPVLFLTPLRLELGNDHPDEPTELLGQNTGLSTGSMRKEIFAIPVHN